MLQHVSLGDMSHAGLELLATLLVHAEIWLTPPHLQLFVCREHHRQCLNNMVAEYIRSRVEVKDSMDYWVSRLDNWLELAQYALGLLVCMYCAVW